MGLLKGIGDFLFGKDAKIFDENGRVRHQFPEKKWTDWEHRFDRDPQYDWKHHGAKERVLKGSVKKAAKRN